MQKAFPQFNRPSEAVVYWALENLCGGAGERLMMPLSESAKQCGLSVSTTNRAVLSLTARGHILYRRGYNQSRQSIFEIPATNGKSPDHTTAQRTIGIPLANDSDSDSVHDTFMGDHDIGQTVHKQNADTEISTEDRLAYRVAEGLDDMQNLALYKNYCRKYPAELILKAFMLAREPEPSKIKKSHGALFNWLCKKMYDKQQHNSHHSGSAAR